MGFVLDFFKVICIDDGFGIKVCIVYNNVEVVEFLNDFVDDVFNGVFVGYV